MNPIALHARRWEKTRRRLRIVSGKWSAREAKLQREAEKHRHALVEEIRRALRRTPGFMRQQRAELYARLRHAEQGEPCPIP